MSHSPFPWQRHPQAPNAVFDADGKRIVWPAPADRWEPIEAEIKCTGCNVIGFGEHKPNCKGFRQQKLYSAPIDPETAADNAALIAAIPEMVQVLTLARAHIDECDYDTEAIALSEHISAVLQKVKQP